MFSLPARIKKQEVSVMNTFRKLAWAIAVGTALTAVAPAAQPARTTTIRGNVDAANRLPGNKNVLDVAGWAADDRGGAPVQKVEILLNDRLAAIAQLGGPRKDVVQALKRNDFLRSGWAARIDLGKYPAGSYRLTARAFNARGEYGPLAIAKLDIRVP
jgi:hypothetical protein